MHDLIALLVYVLLLFCLLGAGFLIGRNSLKGGLDDLHHDLDLMRDKLFECMRKEGMRGDL